MDARQRPQRASPLPSYQPAGLCINVSPHAELSKGSFPYPRQLYSVSRRTACAHARLPPRGVTAADRLRQKSTVKQRAVRAQPRQASVARVGGAPECCTDRVAALSVRNAAASIPPARTPPQQHRMSPGILVDFFLPISHANHTTCLTHILLHPAQLCAAQSVQGKAWHHPGATRRRGSDQRRHVPFQTAARTRYLLGIPRVASFQRT